MKFELEMRDECDGDKTITIEADDLAEAIETAEAELDDWVTDGDWGSPEGCAVRAWYTLTDEDGDEVAADGLTIKIPADEYLLSRKAGGSTLCAHDWTAEGEGGCSENPGVWSTGGTSMLFCTHCRRCGLQRRQSTCGSQRNPGEHDTVEFFQPASWCAECESEECSCSSSSEE